MDLLLRGLDPPGLEGRQLGAVWAALYWGRFVFPGAAGTAGGGEGVTLGPFPGVAVVFGYLGPVVEFGVAVGGCDFPDDALGVYTLPWAATRGVHRPGMWSVFDRLLRSWKNRASIRAGPPN